MKRIASILFIFLLNLSSYSQNYYVSSSTGNDKNDGLTPITAWQTLSKVNSSTFVEGDVIGFKRGDSWREKVTVNQSGTSSNPITYTSYGTGNRPVFIGSQNYTSGWSLHATYPNVWYQTLPNHTQVVLFEGIRGTEVNRSTGDISEIDAPYEWGYEGASFTFKTLYIYSEIDPNTYTSLEVGQLNYGINVNDNDYIKIDDIEFMNYNAHGVFLVGNYCTIQGIESHHHSSINYGDGISIWGNNNLISNNILHENGNHGVFIDHGNNNVIEKNVVYDNYHSQIDLHAMGGSTDNNTIQYNKVYMTYHHTAVGIYIESSTNTTVRYNTIVKNSQGIQFEFNSTGWIYNNTMYDQYNYAIYLQDCTGLIEVKNNIYKNTGSGAFLYSKYITNKEIDYNIFDLSGGAIIAEVNNVEYSVLATYQSVTGFDANSLATDPLFISTSDFRLQDESPAINAGVDVGLTTDFLGNPIVGLPDIGAYEYQDKKTGQINLDAGDDVSICLGSSATLTATGGKSYKWSTGETTQSITVKPDKTTTYTVTVSDDTNSASDNVVVTVNETIANAGADRSIHAGETISLSATGGDTYLWSTGETTESISVSPVVTTTYSVKATKNGCDATDEVKITVNPAPAPGTITANAGPDVNLCKGENTVLTAAGGISYTWSTGETTQSITVKPDRTTTYTVTVSDGLYSASDEVVVNVNEVNASAGPDVTIDSGQAISLNATGGDSYLWSTGETSSMITANPLTTTNYTVKVIKNGCEATDMVQVNVREILPAIADAGKDVTICKGESVTLIGAGGTSYNWNNGTATQNIVVSPTRTTTYTLTANRSGTTSTDQVTVTVINCDLNNGLNNSVSGTTGNTSTSNPSDQDDAQVLNKADFELTVYPIPSEGLVNIQTTIPVYNFNLVLLNINGNVIYSDTLDAHEDGLEKELDLSKFAKGVYLMQLYDEKESYIKKIILM